MSEGEIRRIPERKKCIFLVMAKIPDPYCLGPACEMYDDWNRMCGVLVIARAVSILSTKSGGGVRGV